MFRQERGLSLAILIVGIPARGAVDTSALWRPLDDIASRDVFYGPGGKFDQPRGSFTFIEEDLKGTQPKFVVRDADGVKWTVKLGSEARPETAASRLIWAAGYFANEDYFLPLLTVQSLPARLHRGQKFVAPDGTLRAVRLKKHLVDEKKIGTWDWRANPFSGTREMNGLRALMALLNNWDLTDENNAILERQGKIEPYEARQIYLVSDVGSTLGSGNLRWPMRQVRGNLRSYGGSNFTTRVDADYVDFYSPGRPGLFFLATPREYFHKMQLRWIGRRIPRRDARWIGQVLGRISKDQIRDAFRAAGYPPAEVDAFTNIMQQRIARLEEL